MIDKNTTVADQAANDAATVKPMIEGTITFPSLSRKYGSKAQKDQWRRWYQRTGRKLLKGVVELKAASPDHKAFASLVRRRGWDLKTTGSKSWRLKQSFAKGVEMTIDLKEVCSHRSRDVPPVC